MTRTGWITLFMPLAAAALLLSTSVSGCQGDDDDSVKNTGTATGTNTGTGSGGGNTGTNTGTGTDTSTGGSSTCGTNAVTKTVQEINQGSVGLDVEVKLEGVIAMSQKFLVSGSDTSCLWGVFVTAPGLTTTAEYTGTLALSYGFPPEANDAGKFYCPKLGEAPCGDKIPDDTQPGDELTLIGKTAEYLSSSCTNPGDSQVAQKQLHKVCFAEKTDSGKALPTAATITAYDSVSSATDSDFHAKWGGVKIRLETITALIPGPDDNPYNPGTDPCQQGAGGGGGTGAGGSGTGGGGGAQLVADSINNYYGEIKLEQAGIKIDDKVYYRAYQKYDNVCKAGPRFCTTNGSYAWTFIEGFHYLNWCSWGLVVNDKCADMDPRSEDCTAATCAPY